MRSVGAEAASSPLVSPEAPSPPPQLPSARARTTRSAARRKRSGLHRGQGKAELAALARPARDPDPAPVLGDDALADRQADARPGIGVLAVQALERDEDALGVG